MEIRCLARRCKRRHEAEVAGPQRPPVARGPSRSAACHSAGRTVTVDLDGYSFAPRDVFVTGGTIDIGDLAALGTIQPANVEAERDPTSATDDAFDGMVTVTWDAGGDDAGVITYQVEACVPNADAEPAVTCEEASDNWSELGNNPVTAGDPNAATESVPANSDGGFMVRVHADRPEVTVDDVTVPAATETSAAVEVDAINAAPSLAAATRDIDPSPDDLVVKWNGDRSDATVTRVIGGFTSAGTTTWVVLSAVAFDATGYSADDAAKDHQWTFAFENADGLPELPVVNPANGKFVDAAADGTDDTMDLTVAMMEGTFMVRVQARQPDIDLERDDDGDLVMVDNNTVDVWKASNNASVTAKP